MRIVVAIDSMKGCLSSADANRAAADGVRNVFPHADIVQIPVSDGGEGFIDAFQAAIGGTLQKVTVRDPMMRYITAKYLLRDQEAVIEMAQASGLTLLAEEERNPMVATSYGTGQLIADAVRKGAKRMIVGLGDVPVCLIAGRIRDRETLLQAGFSDVRCINPEGISLQEAMRPEVARKNISDTIRALFCSRFTTQINSFDGTHWE